MMLLLFYSPKPRSQVRILIYRKWPSELSSIPILFSRALWSSQPAEPTDYRANFSTRQADNVSPVSTRLSAGQENLSQQTLPLTMQYGGLSCGHGSWRWKVAISFRKCFSDVLFIAADVEHVNLQSFLKTFSYSLEEEIELLEAIYIHELTLEGPRERQVEKR